MVRHCEARVATMLCARIWEYTWSPDDSVKADVAMEGAPK